MAMKGWKELNGSGDRRSQMRWVSHKYIEGVPGVSYDLMSTHSMGVLGRAIA